MLCSKPMMSLWTRKKKTDKEKELTDGMLSAPLLFARTSAAAEVVRMMRIVP